MIAFPFFVGVFSILVPEPPEIADDLFKNGHFVAVGRRFSFHRIDFLASVQAHRFDRRDLAVLGEFHHKDLSFRFFGGKKRKCFGRLSYVRPGVAADGCKGGGDHGDLHNFLAGQFAGLDFQNLFRIEKVAPGIQARRTARKHQGHGT